ncbi:MAG: magnesium transporter [Gammaproteobacteria bacterium]
MQPPSATEIAPPKRQLLLLLAQWRDAAPEASAPPPTDEVAALFARMHEADIADALESVPPEQRTAVWGAIAAAVQPEVLMELSEEARIPLLVEMPEQDLARLFRGMSAEDVAELLRDIRPAARARLVRLAGMSDDPQLRASLTFEDDTVGALMDFDAVIVRETDSIGALRDRLQEMGELPSHCDKLFVADLRDRLCGVLPLKRLLLNPPSAAVRDVMVSRGLHFFRPEDGVEKAAGAFERYDIISAPVLDDENKIAGRITIDEILDHLQQSRALGLINSAGVAGEEDLFASLPRRFGNRWKWLGINLIAVFLISLVVGVFEDAIMRVVALAALMPVVAGMSGNVGNQTATLTVRALALDRINTLNWRAVVRGELSLSVINGLIWGSAVGIFAYLVYGRTDLSLVLTASMTFCFAAAALTGFFFPLLMKKLGKDPALGASVVLTSVVDTLGFLVFLGMGALFLA